MTGAECAPYAFQTRAPPDRQAKTNNGDNPMTFRKIAHVFSIAAVTAVAASSFAQASSTESHAPLFKSGKPSQTIVISPVGNPRSPSWIREAFSPKN